MHAELLAETVVRHRLDRKRLFGLGFQSRYPSSPLFLRIACGCRGCRTLSSRVAWEARVCQSADCTQSLLLQSGTHLRSAVPYTHQNKHLRFSCYRPRVDTTMFSVSCGSCRVLLNTLVNAPCLLTVGVPGVTGANGTGATGSRRDANCRLP